MTNNKLREINSFEQLRSYLIERGNSHHNYWHYTNKDGLLGILESGYFHLTSLVSLKMNDLQEGSKGNFQERRKLYEMSFAYSSENMAMWGLYGIPLKESLCVILPKKAINTIINNGTVVYEIENNGQVRNSYHECGNCEEVFMTDIAYLNGKRDSLHTTIKHNNEILKISSKPQLRGISSEKILTGLIKNDVWSYENESRLIVKFSNNSDNKIAIKIPEKAFKDFKIYFSPWVKDEFKNNIKNTLISNFNFEENQFENSKFENLVNYRDLCNYCEYEFKRK